MMTTNFQNIRTALSTASYRNVLSEKNIRTEEDLEELATHYVILIVDVSGSIAPMEEEVYNQTHAIFTGLASANEKSTDMRTLVKLVFFNNKVQEFNSAFMEPQQLTDTFTRADYHCFGTTNGGALFEYIDKELSSHSAIVKSLKKNSPKITFVIITDAKLNDNASLREQHRKILASNRYYSKYSNTLVVFLGEDKDKDTAVAVAGGNPDNVVAIGTDMVELLSPVIIGSTVTFADGTHMSNEGEQTIADITNSAQERAEEGTTSANALKDDDLRRKLLELMGKNPGAC